MPRHLNVSYSITVRLELLDRPGTFARVAAAVGKAGAGLDAVDLVSVHDGVKTRDITLMVSDVEHGKAVLKSLRAVRGIKVLGHSDRTFLVHIGGKMEIRARTPVKTRDDLSMVYTPGVGRVSTAIHEDPEKAWNLTIKGNAIAIVTDGTAVLGLGDIGPLAALPVMEGKAVLFKTFAGIDAFPICLNTKDPKEIVETVCRIAPVFGGINLEDISSPRCFEIEEELKKRLDIPVMHDDQHGTAVVVLAGLINALRVVGRGIRDVRAVISGAGAAAVAVARLLKRAGVRDIVCCDRAGALYRERPEHMNAVKRVISRETNPRRYQGKISGALKGAHIFIGLSAPGSVKVSELERMAKRPIIMALANPTPEVDPGGVHRFAGVVATGRSDYPNQINNALAFPGIFRGALSVRASTINDTMKLAAAKAIASVVRPSELSHDYVMPSIFNPRVVERVVEAVSKAAFLTKVARRRRQSRSVPR